MRISTSPSGLAVRTMSCTRSSVATGDACVPSLASEPAVDIQTVSTTAACAGVAYSSDASSANATISAAFFMRLLVGVAERDDDGVRGRPGERHGVSDQDVGAVHHGQLDEPNAA